ncbi:hypothetical protein NECID01_1053 [Nematocida sp. AWRm77]|nr:hypothetical protein NECID01_1053 [Nematocida sp. AWRm77]
MEKFLAKAKEEKPFEHIYSLASVKETIDKVLKEYLVNVCKYREDPSHTNVTLFFGVTNTILCCILIYMSMQMKFVVYRPYAICIVVLFWSLSSLERIATWLFFEYTFIGKNQKKKEIKIITKLDPPSTVYTVLVYFGKKQIPSKISVPITTLYTSEHKLDYKFFADLLNEGLQSES